MIRRGLEWVMTQLERVPSGWGLPGLLALSILIWIAALKLLHVI